MDRVKSVYFFLTQLLQVRGAETHAIVLMPQTGPRAERRALREAAERRAQLAVDAEGERALIVIHDDLDYRAVRSAG